MPTQSPYSIPIPQFFLNDKPKSAGPISSSETLKPYAKPEVLEQYANDLYKLFLAKLVHFDSASSVSTADAEKLQSLLDELVYVKTLLASH